jgi:hypothetical protein
MEIAIPKLMPSDHITSMRPRRYTGTTDLLPIFIVGIAQVERLVSIGRFHLDTGAFLV